MLVIQILLLCIYYSFHIILVLYCRFYCTMVAAKRILVKLPNICVNTPDKISLFYWSTKLCLVALSAYISKSDGPGENVSSEITNVQTSFMAWFSSTEFGDYFGGKYGKLIKDEIKVRFCTYT